MSANKENQFWRLRSKDGRDRVIESPDQLAELADEYFQECVGAPLEVIDFKGKVCMAKWLSAKSHNPVHPIGSKKCS